MNIYKCIELLKLYLTEKMDETNVVIKKTLSDEVDDIVASVVSAIFSTYISGLFNDAGIWALLRFVFIVVPLYISFRFLIKKIRRYFKTKNESQSSDKEELTEEKAAALINKFDHVACEGVLISRDFLKKYIFLKEKEDNLEKEDDNSKHERVFYLIESFYYYKKSLDIVTSVVLHAKSCINSTNVSDGISLYRLNNLHETLKEIITDVKQYVNECDFEHKNQMLTEIKMEEKKSEKITQFIDAQK